MTRTFFFIMIVVLTLFFILLEFTIPYHVLFHVQNAAAMILGFAVISAFWPGLVESMRASKGNRLSPGVIMVLGVCTNWAGMLLRQVSYYIASDLAHLSLQYISFPLWATGLWLTLIGGIIHLIALRSPGVIFFQRGSLTGAAGTAALIGLTIVLAWGAAHIAADRTVMVESRLCLPPGPEIRE